MSWEGIITIAVGVFGLTLQSIAMIVTGIVKLGRTENAIRAEIASHKLENEERINGVLRSVGETMAAHREKVREVELYIRDTYLQKESFRVVIAEISKNMEQLGDRIESRMQRMENKLDAVKEGSNSP